MSLTLKGSHMVTLRWTLSGSD